MTAMFTPNGKTELPFEIPLKPKGSKPLYETYHGVFVNIQVFPQLTNYFVIMFTEVTVIISGSLKEPPTNRLAQLVERRTTMQEVVGSKLNRTKNQGLKINGKIMLAVCSTSASA